MLPINRESGKRKATRPQAKMVDMEHNGNFILLATLALLSCLSVIAAAADMPANNVQTPFQVKLIAKSQGVETFAITSPYQSGKPELRILTPDQSDTQDEASRGKRRVLFVLPVEAGNTKRWGDGFAHIKKLGLHNKHNLIVVAPTFSQLPWYADHPTDQAIRQESHFIKAVVPYICKRFDAKPQQCLLLGFSKSGWGAYSLILRNPKQFAAAAAWDAPLMQAKPNSFGMGPIFSTQENFEKYHVSKLLADADDSFKSQTRLVLTGYDNFRKHHVDAHALMDKHNIKHVYKDGPKVKHHWDSGWVTEAVELLVELN